MPDNPGLPGAHVELRDISKSFGGARALEAVSLRIGRGSIHALVGENGAGKSTLGKIIAGDIAPDRGQLLVDGHQVHFHSPRAAMSSGIVRIAQELSIVPSLSVAQNVFLGAEPRQAGFLRKRELRQRYAELAARAGFDLDGDANAGSLRTADQQKTEILRALNRDAALIVMDEPTAALSRPDVETLHEIIRGLARAGTTIVLVSHFLGEVLELAGEVTILRDGRVVQSTLAAGQTEESLLRAMLGRSLGATFPVRQPAAPDAPVVLSVSGLTAPGVNDVSLRVSAGEIVGLAGLVGAGRTELARAVYRAGRSSAGDVRLAGDRKLTGRAPRDALQAGVAMIPESRKEQGLLLRRSVAENVSLSSLGQFSRGGLVTRSAERREVEKILRELDVRTAGQNALAGSLSGGNQQKLLFARTLLAGPRVLIADEPTRGVDVGAKRAIYELLTSLAARGLGVLLISSDVEEVLGLAHRVLVMRAGRIVAELDGEAATEAAILGAAFGSAERGA
ncbi:MAG TPA: sugar ABC transporter ATP-binding protein [Streptosporangiaceae bacterium]